MIGISKGAVNDYVTQACTFIQLFAIKLLSGQLKNKGTTSVEELERCMVLLIALV